MQVTALRGFHPSAPCPASTSLPPIDQHKNQQHHDLSLTACVTHVLNPECYLSPDPRPSPFQVSSFILQLSSFSFQLFLTDDITSFQSEMFRGSQHVAVIGIDFTESVLPGAGEVKRIDRPEKNLGGEFFIPLTGGGDDPVVRFKPDPYSRGTIRAELPEDGPMGGGGEFPSRSFR